jgi:hypothetical protein
MNRKRATRVSANPSLTVPTGWRKSQLSRAEECGCCNAAALRARNKEILMKKQSELCELGVSVVKKPSN